MIARVRGSSPEAVSQIIHANFLRMVENDAWLKNMQPLLVQSER
jgi:hypothetical protein